MVQEKIKEKVYEVYHRTPIWFKKLSLYHKCVVVSLSLHFGIVLLYVILNTNWFNQDDEIPSLTDVDVEIQDIPPELLGGDSSPAPVEKSEWVEGTNKDTSKDADPNDEIKDQLSGDGTDKDGFLFSYRGDKPPTPILDFDLRYYFPASAKAANITEMTVVVEIQVDEKGTLLGSRIVGGKAGYGFDEAAIQIVKRARFSPGLIQGKPVKMNHRLPINFTLED